MPATGVEFLPLADWVTMFMAVLARLSPVIFLMPGIGEEAIPARVRLALLISLSLTISSMGVVDPISMSAGPGYIELLFGELLIGFVFGVSLRAMLWILNSVGAIVAQSIGLAQFLGVALQTEAQTITANLLSIAGAALLLTANFHVAVFANIMKIFESVPAHSLQNADIDFIIRALFDAFNFAITLSWPFVLASLIYNICLGFINKAMPQMMVAFVGAPFMVGAGLILLTVSALSLFFVWLERAPAIMGLG
ncbi:MAG: flagellar biosynthetic protein FliR [Pseudomonadota bacterium]